MSRKLQLFAFAFLFTVTLLSLLSTFGVAAADDAADGSPAAVVAPVAAKDGETKAPKDKIKKPHRRSLFQACRSDIMAHDCLSQAKKANDGTGAGRRAAISGTLACLNDNIEKIKDKTCKEWLGARKTCADETTALCPDDSNNGEDAENKPRPGSRRAPIDKVTKCLMKVDPLKLSAECRQSDYFRSLVFQKMWRANRDKRIKGNFEVAKKKDVGADGGNNNNNNGGASAADGDEKPKKPVRQSDDNNDNADDSSSKKQKASG